MLSVRLPGNKRLLVVKSGQVKSYMQYAGFQLPARGVGGISTPNLSVV